ncbi:TolC family protein [Roseomonas sp. CCTCC AB2023176]|uniref:TolC family protein n=1 Tax=Roseomonas sp. CCTCC AB2023176 TaxID=3342640 RepID=UPI0035E0C015
MRGILLLAAALALPAPADAAGIREGFAGALGLSAEVRTLEAQRPVTDARRARADALLPGAPTLNGGVRSDAVAQNRGYLQLDAGASAPLWLPGESRALRGLADAQGASTDRSLARARLLLAGQVREAYWTWAIAAAAAEAGRTRLAAARALESDVGRGVGAGNAPRTDLLVATAATREAEAALREATAAARTAAIAFRVLTGLEPTAAPEERAAASGAAPAAPRDDDPRLAAGRAAVEANRANERLAAARDRANPDIGLGVRVQRDARGEDLSPNAVVSGRLPLRHGPTYREALAEARATTAASEAELAATERALRGAVDRAREARAAALDPPASPRPATARWWSRRGSTRPPTGAASCRSSRSRASGRSSRRRMPAAAAPARRLGAPPPRSTRCWARSHDDANDPPRRPRARPRGRRDPRGPRA